MLREMVKGKSHTWYGHSDEEVEAKRAAYYAAQTAQDAAQHTFGHHADNWWEEKQKHLSPNSIGNFKTAYNRCSEQFGSRPVAEIRAQEVYVFLQRYAAQDYSARVINNLKTVCKQVFDLAFIEGDIDRNPCADLPPIKGKATVPREAAGDRDLVLLEQHKLDSLMARMHYFMLYTGCRRGEAVGLQQKHIDRAAGVAHIVQSVAYGSQSPKVKTPKSAAGCRDVQLLDNVLAILPEYDDPETFVFFPEGLPTMKRLEYGMSQFQKKTGLACTAHQLRHSYASMLHSAGISPKDAQVLLGHSSIDMTMNIYTHLEQRQKDAVRNKLNDFVSTVCVK